MDILRKQIKAFLYLPKADCFVVAPEFQAVCDRLNLTEWSAVVWMGRLFARDQDFGEHWFDNWDEREELEKRGVMPEQMDSEQMMIVVPEKFTEHEPFCIHCWDKDNPKPPIEKMSCPHCGGDVKVSPDGPCHSDKSKKLFWTDVLDSLHISLNTLFELARESEEKNSQFRIEEAFDVEDAIKEVTQAYEERFTIGF